MDRLRCKQRPVTFYSHNYVEGWNGGGRAGGYFSSPGGGGGGSSHVNSQLFTNTVCKAGNEEFLSPMGIAETGHSGPGLVRITLLETY